MGKEVSYRLASHFQQKIIEINFRDVEILKKEIKSHVFKVSLLPSGYPKIIAAQPTGQGFGSGLI